MIPSHKKPKRHLETRITAISFNEFSDPGVDLDGNDSPLMEWRRDGHEFHRLETPTVDGYAIDHEAAVRRRKTSVRKALLEAIPLYRRLWLEGLSNQGIIRLLSHSDYFELIYSQADDDEGYLVNNSIHFFTDGVFLTWQEGEEFMVNHRKFYPSNSPGGMWYRDECDECECTGVDPYTEKQRELCNGTGFSPEEY